VRWYQISLRRIIARGGDLRDVLVPLLMLMMTLFVGLMGLTRSRMEPHLA
jgi:hypothetical protein